ncbi:MAG: aspartate ammonia-lyase [Bacteroidetes bacterium]|nr:aspartate ammonia-lyase [Bacteroidota bacterium]
MDRTEKDYLGEHLIPTDALYGIHSKRAFVNFPGTNLFPVEWYMAMGSVKESAYRTYSRFRTAAAEKYGHRESVRIISDDIVDAMMHAAGEVARGNHFGNFIVPGIQGGAGTSINMNVNEIIANAALKRLGHSPGDYHIIDPVEDCNIYQSTNDVVPTALTIAVMRLLNELATGINSLRQAMEELERENRTELRPGYTQMQEALPSSFGMLFGAYNEALARDWWRVSKSLERIKTINMGGGATGTGLGIPRYFIMEVVPELRNSTGLPLARSENMPDATSNLDKWVEVHSTIKSHAVNLEKIASDLRLLASDLVSPRQLQLPERQVGSSIMPGKINPVIPEYIISVSHRVYANDNLITSLAAQGCLELNAYLPAIGCAVIESINLLIAANHTLLENSVKGLTVNRASSFEKVLFTPAVTTALVPYIGYNKASEAARMMKEHGISVIEANNRLNLIDQARLNEILQPANLLKTGFSLEEI